MINCGHCSKNCSSISKIIYIYIYNSFGFKFINNKKIIIFCNKYKYIIIYNKKKFFDFKFMFLIDLLYLHASFYSGLFILATYTNILQNSYSY